MKLHGCFQIWNTWREKSDFLQGEVARYSAYVKVGPNFNSKVQNYLQVLENIISRQGSSQLASSPLKVLASWLAFTPFVIIVIKMNAMLSKAFRGLSWIHKLVLLPQILTMLLHQRFLLMQFHIFQSLMNFSNRSCFFLVYFDIGQSRTWSTIVDFLCTTSHPNDRVLYSS